MNSHDMLAIPKALIEKLNVSHCAGIIVDKNAYLELMEMARSQPPVQGVPTFEWPATSNVITAAYYKQLMVPKVESLMIQLIRTAALKDTYKSEVVTLHELVIQQRAKLDGRINTADPVDERTKFEAYAREKGLNVDLALWNMSNPPQFKEYVDKEAQAFWVMWQDMRTR